MKKTILKLGMMAAFMLSASIGFAQKTAVDGSDDIGKKTNANIGTLNGSVKVIDNKGTKKYLQVQNGITLLTDLAPDGGIISTWQLGGVLTDDTTIDATNAIFAVKGVKEIDATANPVSDIAATAATINVSGFTLMVRDEATGETKKMLATDLIQSGYTKTTGASATIDLGVTLPAFKQVYVYRNGAKLVADTDYSIATTIVTLLPQSNGDEEDWALYPTDVIEVHFMK